MKCIAGRMTIGCMIALMSVTVACAQQTAPEKPAQKTNIKPVPKLDAEALRIPHSIHDSQVKKLEKPDKALPTPSMPNKVDLGKYDLEFRAKHSSEVNPRTGFDSGEKSVLSNSSIGRKSDTALPNYFGLKLSTPTN